MSALGYPASAWTEGISSRNSWARPRKNNGGKSAMAADVHDWPAPEVRTSYSLGTPGGDGDVVSRAHGCKHPSQRPTAP
ncbi:hypothetical protein GCM10022244_22810 [Streptomyces gulbargensis]|uniref:Uncharacterized protein n=1 Tax=Streptomyces gulbargensis TaxID=364901 RepID=A0ABP7M1K5_9ACTN